MGVLVDFLINLYGPMIGNKIKSECLKNIFNNKYKKIYKLNWCDVKGKNKNLVKKGSVILDRDIFLDINVNLSFAEKCKCGIVFMKNNEILYASENGGLTLNFNIADIFAMNDKLQLLILTNDDINFFDLGCNWYLGAGAEIDGGVYVAATESGPVRLNLAPRSM